LCDKSYRCEALEGSLKLKYWILFAATQVVGLLLPPLGNVHINVLPIVIGTILLLPGSLVGFLLPDSSSWWGWYVLAVGINQILCGSAR
jgi:hypothetical protein